MTTIISGDTGISPVTASGTSASVDGMTVGRGGGEVSTNTAVGASALAANTTGSLNTAIGYQALDANTTGLTNTAVGENALGANTTSNDNTAVGRLAAAFNTTGTSLSVLGSGALYANTTGSYNTAIGKDALVSNTTASNNTAVGYQAGYTNTTGAYNTFVGRQAGYTCTGGDNTFIGFYAGALVTTGTYNTFVGDGSGEAVTTGGKNTIIGKYSGNQGGLDIRTSSNYIVLSDGDGNPRAHWNGSGAFSTTTTTSGWSQVFTNAATGINTLGLLISWAGAPNNTAGQFINCSDNANARFIVYANGNTVNQNNSYGAVSDIKLKENIVDATPKLEDLCKVKVRQYNLKSDPTHKQIGVVAQELEEVFAGMVEETPDKDQEGNDLGTTTKGVKYSVFVPMLIKSIQELKTIVDAQAAEIAELKAR